MVMCFYKNPQCELQSTIYGFVTTVMLTVPVMELHVGKRTMTPLCSDQNLHQQVYVGATCRTQLYSLIPKPSYYRWSGNETKKVCSPFGDHRSVYHHIAVRQLKYSHVNEVEVKPQVEAARKASGHDQMFYI